MLEYLETIWRRPDQSIWEPRDGPQQFTFSKIGVWTAFDRAIRLCDEAGLAGLRALTSFARGRAIGGEEGARAMAAATADLDAMGVVNIDVTLRVFGAL